MRRIECVQPLLLLGLSLVLLPLFESKRERRTVCGEREDEREKDGAEEEGSKRGDKKGKTRGRDEQVGEERDPEKRALQHVNGNR